MAEKPAFPRKVRRFLAQYDIDVSDCTQQTFRCFNDFFTRQRVRTNDRAALDELPAIADSKLTALPIGEDSVFTVKDVSYRSASCWRTTRWRSASSAAGA